MAQFRSSPEHDVLVLNKRQASLIASVLILISFFIFIAGYFWGKKRAFEQFTSQVSQDSFADQVYYASLYSTYGGQSAADESGSENEQMNKIDQAPRAPEVQEVLGKKHYAQLVGFGTEKAARKCVARLEKKGISVLVKKRLSTTASGKKVRWYQVVTSPYAQRDQLEKLVDQIKRLERIKDVRIVVV